MKSSTLIRLLIFALFFAGIGFIIYLLIGNGEEEPVVKPVQTAPKKPLKKAAEPMAGEKKPAEQKEKIDKLKKAIEAFGEQIEKEEEPKAEEKAEKSEESFEDMIAKNIRKQQSEMVELAKKHCNPNGAKKFENISSCILDNTLGQKSDDFQNALNETRRCNEQFGAEDPDYDECKDTVQIEFAKKSCDGSEVQIISDLNACIKESGAQDTMLEGDMQGASEKMDACMKKHDMKKLSPKCLRGMSGF